MGFVDAIDIAASVDDLPDPVGPVTRTIPFCRSTISRKLRGQIQVASKVGIAAGSRA